MKKIGSKRNIRHPLRGLAFVSVLALCLLSPTAVVGGAGVSPFHVYLPQVSKQPPPPPERLVVFEAFTNPT
jgi:hypothetical protein